MDQTFKVHELKILPDHYNAILNLKKSFEIRKNDRMYKVGDYLLLKEYLEEEKAYTGCELFVEVVYMSNYEQKDCFVVMGIEAKAARLEYEFFNLR